MTKKKKTGTRLSAEQWANVRKRYETTAISMNALANELNGIISRQGLDKRAKRDGWIKGEIIHPDDTARRTALKLADITREMGPEEVEERLESLAEMRAALVRKHRDMWKEIDGIYNDAVKAYRDETFMPEDIRVRYALASDEGRAEIMKKEWSNKDRLRYADKLFSIYKRASDGLMLHQEGERRAYSFDYKMQIDAEHEDVKEEIEVSEMRARLAKSFRELPGSDEIAAIAEKTVH